MPRCSVKGCGLGKSEDQPQLSLHSLPKNESMKNKWLDVIGQENLKLWVKRVFICSLHFEESCFNRTLNLIRLRDDAIPSRLLLPGDKRKNTILSDKSNIQNLSQLAVKLEMPKLEPDPLSLDTEESQPSASHDLANVVPTPKYCKESTPRMSDYLMQNTQLKQKIKKLEFACKNKRIQTKRLCETVRRRNKTLALLKGIIKDLKINTKKEDVIKQNTYCVEDIIPPQTTDRIEDISLLQNCKLENTDRIKDINTKIKEEFIKSIPPNTARKVHHPKIMIKVGDFRKCCRLCLTKVGEMKQLFGASLDQMVMDISSLKMSIGDGFPQQACVSCIRRLSAAYNFRTMILDSHDTLSFSLSAKSQAKTQTFEEEIDEDDDDDVDDDDDEKPRRAVVTLDSISNLITIDSAAVAKIKNKSNITKEEIWRENNTSDIENDGENERINVKEEIDEVDNIDEKLKHTMYDKSDDDSWSVASTGFPSDFQSLETPDEGTETLKCVPNTCAKKPLLKQHLQMHQEKCGKMTEKHNFSRLMKAHEKLGRYVCAVCGKVFADKNRIRKHERLHSLQKAVPIANNLCPYCGKKFKWVSSLSKHLRYHTGHNLYKCSVCHKSFSSRHYWKLHERSHIEKAFECSICKRRFTQQSSMRKHVRTIHAANRPDKFQCDQCSQSFFDKDILMVHISKKHSTKRLFKCDSCDKSFSNMKLLKSHSKLHIREREQTAGEEEEQFILRDDDHDYGKKMMRTLTVEYMCFKCEGKFATCDELKTHAENCKEASSNSSNSESSSKLQIVNICKLCHSVFTQTSHLLEHYNTEHNVLAVIDEKTGKKNITVFAEIVLKNDATPPSEPKKKYFIRTEMI